MARFVLIHGSFQGAWCWREVVPRLRACGHEAVAIDLPGHGEDRAPLEMVTFQDYVERTIEAARDEAILVGHSMGGAVVRQAAGASPERVRALVCVASLLPANGANMLSFVEGFDPQYLAQIVWAADRRTARISEEGARRFLFDGCPAEVVESVLPLLTAEPVAPYETALWFGEVRAPMYYVECSRDRVVPVAMQASMHAGFPAARVYSLDSGHAACFAAAEELARVLDRIAG
jgi:pimeloyl-ACP methyl ester carboxylesterase